MPSPGGVAVAMFLGESLAAVLVFSLRALFCLMQCPLLSHALLCVSRAEFRLSSISIGSFWLRAEQ